MTDKVLKKRVFFKNRYGEDISFLVRKPQPKEKKVPVVSVEFLKDSVKWLKGTSYDKYRKEGRGFDEGYEQAFKDLLSAVKKEAEKE